MRPLLLSILAATTCAVPLAAADPAPFELTGPDLRIEVVRGERTLPIAQVPSLAAGDKVIVHGDFAQDQGANFLLVSAFLRGATNPPPKDWLDTARTWKSKEKDKALTLTVPRGARQMVLLLVPETGGAEGALVDAVRGKPGEFVRASQDLNQASLDHSRLAAFMAAIRAQDDNDPDHLRTVAPVLASSLSIKLQADCLSKVIEQQASCLVQDRESLVLSDVHSSSIADTLTGTPTDLALQLSATREGGAGYYSAYIGVARDIARIFGAFSNPSFNYLPTLTVRQGETMSLLLNAAPSFQKPKSVMVAALPAIEADIPPQLRGTAKGAICAVATGAEGAVLPVEGAPLVFSTQFAHEMKARLTAASGQVVEVPVTARADKGGYVLAAERLPAAFTGTIRAHLHGEWGFAGFDGPDFVLQRPDGSAWKASGGADGFVVGRDNDVVLEGSAPSCVEEVTLRQANGAARPVKWQAQGGDRLGVTVPLEGARPGEMRVEVRYRGAREPGVVALRARAAPRLQVSLLNRTVEPAPVAPGLRALDLGVSGELLPDTGELVFSVKAGAGTRFGAGDSIEIAPDSEDADTGVVRLAVGKGLTLASPDVLVARLAGAEVPAGTFGPLRFRAVRAGAVGDWQPLATLVRLPGVQAVSCEAQGCTITARALFLVDAVGADAAFAQAASVPAGYTGTTLRVPRPADGALYLRLRDAPGSVVKLPVG